MSSDYPRDLIGYGPNPPKANWPGGARVAVQFVMNYEEGGENCILHGDKASEAFLSEIVGAQPWEGERHMSMESIYEYGSRVGVWRLLDLFRTRQIPITVFAVAMALDRNQLVAETALAQCVTATPHIGASTEEAADAIADDVVRIVRTFHQTGKPPAPINMCLRSPATHSLVIRHYNRVGVLAGILDLLREENINVEEMENTIFDGAEAACCTLQLDAAPSAAAQAALERNELILQVTFGSR